MSLGVPSWVVWICTSGRQILVVSSLSAYFLSPIGVVACLAWGRFLLQSTGSQPLCRHVVCVQGDLPGPSKGLQLSEAKGIKLQKLLLLSSSGGRMSAQGVGGLSLSWSNLAFAGLSGGARKFGARRGRPQISFPGRPRAAGIQEACWFP